MTTQTVTFLLGSAAADRAFGMDLIALLAIAAALVWLAGYVARKRP